jgi:hypothetical protein
MLRPLVNGYSIKAMSLRTIGTNVRKAQKVRTSSQIYRIDGNPTRIL